MTNLVRATFSSTLFWATVSNATTVLWIGAHPDDELYVAPILKEICPQSGVSCHLLVATDGGKWHGSLNPNWTYSQVANWRINELYLSASYLNSTVDLIHREDTASNTVIGDLQNWNKSLGGNQNDAVVLTNLVSAYISQLHPDYIFTFDPRHGVYCQVDHRAVGLMALASAQQAGFDLSRLFLVESRHTTGAIQSTQTPIWAGFTTMVPSDTAVSVYNAATQGTWSTVTAGQALHASQFSSSTVGYFSAAYAVGQNIPLWQASQIVSNDPHYTNICPEVFNGPLDNAIIWY